MWNLVSDWAVKMSMFVSTYNYQKKSLHRPKQSDDQTIWLCESKWYRMVVDDCWVKGCKFDTNHGFFISFLGL